MPRPLWTGSISFGLVNIPVKLYPAVHEQAISFHLVSADGQCRLRRKLVCPETGQEYDYDNTALGYEIGPDQYVVVNREELNKLKPESSRTINIEQFVKLDEIDPIYFDRAYYLGPDERGTKAYRLLFEAMKESGRVAVARFVMRNNEYLAVLRVMGDIIGLETMHYHYEIARQDDIAESDDNVKVAKKELDLAKQLVESLTEEFNPEKYKNEYQEQVKEMIDAKAEGKEIVTQEAPVKGTGRVIDIMDALRKSLQDKGGARRSEPKTKTRGKTPSKASAGRNTRKKRANE